MRIKTGLLALAIGLAPLSIAAAQVTTRQDPRDRRPTSTSGTIGDIIFGSSRADSVCRVRDAVTPDGRVVQVCDDRKARRGDDDDDEGGSFEHRRDGRGRRAHVNDRDGDGDFDARDRAIRKQEHALAKARKKQLKAR